MFQFTKPDKNILVATILVLCMLAGYCFVKIYQPKHKTITIYKQALQDYENKDYQNSYYLFSKIGTTSVLKPAALYHQAICARTLGDIKSELSAYQAIAKYYPNNIFATEARYRAGQILAEKNPKQAINYFNEVVLRSSDEDYKVAAKYYIAKLKTKDIQAYKNYLTNYPDGRLALEVVNTWLETGNVDYALVGKALYFAGKNKEALEILNKTDVSQSWAIRAALAKKTGNNAQLKDLVYQGVSNYADNVETSDYKRAVMEYLKTEPLLYTSVSNLLNIAHGKNKDYIWSLKCRYAPYSEKSECYEKLYENYLNSEYAEDIMPNLVLYKVLTRDYATAQKVADDFILKYPESEKVPMVMFWRAKIEQLYAQNPKYEIFYKNIINNYPDSYYAYRSFWITHGLRSSVINAKLKLKTVEYPYKYPQKSSLLYNLLLVEDFELIEKSCDDGFIKSWAQYKQGNYVQSMHTAKLAMDKLKQKPPKNDARWFLVYPMNYYKQVQKTAQDYGNNDALIIALIKEESSFNPNVQSGVGAIGLMQLMPSTAHDIWKNEFSTTDLLNPEFNIKIGNLYYAGLRKELDDMDISAVAAYNGGIGSVQNWKNRLLYNDTDEFVEQIPYEETKDYVKKVFRSYWNYTRVYQE